MTNTHRFRRLAAYNRWMNEKIYAVCGEIPDAERKRDLGAFFRSIHGTLNHLLLTDRIWLGRLTGKPFAVASLADELYGNFDELRHARSETDAAITAYVGALDAKALASCIRYRRIVDGTWQSLALEVALTHLFNHQTHHRGQVTALISQLGRDYGVTDLISMPEVENL